MSTPAPFTERLRAGLAGYGKFDTAISSENKAKVQALLDDIRAGKVSDLPTIR